MPSEAALPRFRKPVAARTVLLIAALGVFMAFVDNTIVTIAFPDMLESFPDSDLSSLSWVFNIYNVALAALLIPAGRIADIAGRRRLFVAGIVLFTVASVLCAAAPTIGVLIAARGIQGAGAAILIPASLGLILHASPEERRTQAIAVWSATGALAAGIGPSIGGLLVELASWRLVFLINLPVGILVGSSLAATSSRAARRDGEPSRTSRARCCSPLRSARSPSRSCKGIAGAGSTRARSPRSSSPLSRQRCSPAAARVTPRRSSTSSSSARGASPRRTCSRSSAAPASSRSDSRTSST